MFLQEPKAEFVPIDFKVVTDQCASAAVQTIGGGQRCIASQEDATECEDFDSMVPW